MLGFPSISFYPETGSLGFMGLHNGIKRLGNPANRDVLCWTYTQGIMERVRSQRTELGNSRQSVIRKGCLSSLGLTGCLRE